MMGDVISVLTRDNWWLIVVIIIVVVFVAILIRSDDR